MTLAFPVGEDAVIYRGQASGIGSLSAEPHVTAAATPPPDLQGGPVRGVSPGPDAPGVPPTEPDRAAVARGPAFVRGAARSGDGLIAASRGRTCAVRADGGVTCWGKDGIRERLSAAGLERVVSISSGDHPHQQLHVCALHGNGAVSCWGAGLEGQLGRGETRDRYLPARVPGVYDAVALAAGSDHTCAVHADGGVSCWGSGSLGQLGDGIGAPASRPQRVPGLSGIEKIDAGPSSTCTIDAGGSLWCWGLRGGAGNAGAFEPGKVDGLPAVASVSTGGDGTCAATVAGQVYCWPVAATARPLPVAGVAGVVAVAAGSGGACAVHTDGAVSCWGAENAAGQLGNGGTAPQPRPARVAGITDAVAVTMSSGSSRIAPHTCVAHENGSYSCWGGNGVGQLGDGTREPNPTPTPVAEPEKIPEQRIPGEATDLLRAWLDGAVQQRETEFPWLRAAWDHIRDRTTASLGGSLRGSVRSSCHVSDGAVACQAESMEIAEMTLSTAVHELAHVYDSTTGLVTGRAWGAVQLYFAARYPDCFVDDRQRQGSELLADTMTHLVVPAAWLTYYAIGCDGSGNGVDREAEGTVLAGLAGVVPPWYTENITNGAELWTVLRRALSAPLLANLATRFGGFCSTDWFSYPLDRSLIPPARTNPFRDGGC